MGSLSMTRRSALGLLGIGAVGGAVYGLSRSKVLAFLRSDAETPEDFRVVRRPYPSEPGRGTEWGQTEWGQTTFAGGIS